MKINSLGLELIKKFEGLSLKPYKCSADVPTIGYGNTYYEDNKKVSLDDPAITKERAEELLAFILQKFEKSVESILKVSVNENQFAALVSFAYNVGVNNLKSSTLLRKINSNDFGGAANEFLRWNKAKGKELKGLTLRRQAEKDLFLKKPLH